MPTHQTQNSPRKFPSPKRILLGILHEIDSISAQTYCENKHEPLSYFEIMVLILEDRRYFRHHGIDAISIIRDIYKLVTLRKHGGSSTIEMQYVRTITDRRERTLMRKLREMALAFVIQYRHAKITVLRSYMDVVFLGSGLIGADNASYKLFNKTSSELSIEEAAELAAMMVYPRPILPTDAWRQKIERRKHYAIYLFPRLKDRFQ